MNRDPYGYPLEIRTLHAQQYAASTATAQNKGKEPCGCDLHIQAEKLPNVQQLLSKYVPPSERNPHQSAMSWLERNGRV